MPHHYTDNPIAEWLVNRISRKRNRRRYGEYMDRVEQYNASREANPEIPEISKRRQILHDAMRETSEPANAYRMLKSYEHNMRINAGLPAQQAHGMRGFVFDPLGVYFRDEDAVNLFMEDERNRLELEDEFDEKRQGRRQEDALDLLKAKDEQEDQNRVDADKIADENTQQDFDNAMELLEERHKNAIAQQNHQQLHENRKIKRARILDEMAELRPNVTTAGPSIDSVTRILDEHFEGSLRLGPYNSWWEKVKKDTGHQEAQILAINKAWNFIQGRDSRPTDRDIALILQAVNIGEMSLDVGRWVMLQIVEDARSDVRRMHMLKLMRDNIDMTREEAENLALEAVPIDERLMIEPEKRYKAAIDALLRVMPERQIDDVDVSGATPEEILRGVG